MQFISNYKNNNVNNNNKNKQIKSIRNLSSKNEQILASIVTEKRLKIKLKERMCPHGNILSLIRAIYKSDNTRQGQRVVYFILFF